MQVKENAPGLWAGVHTQVYLSVHTATPTWTRTGIPTRTRSYTYTGVGVGSLWG